MFVSISKLKDNMNFKLCPICKAVNYYENKQCHNCGFDLKYEAHLNPKKALKQIKLHQKRDL